MANEGDPGLEGNLIDFIDERNKRRGLKPESAVLSQWLANIPSHPRDELKKDIIERTRKLNQGDGQ